MLENLIDKIDILEKKIALLLDLQLQQTNSLRTYNDVAKFLGKSSRTIQNYIKDEKFQQDIHFVHDENKKVIFIPKAIIEFKNGVKNQKDAITPVKRHSRINHPTVTRMLKGVA